MIDFNTKGIEFVMTALFAVMFMTQWDESKEHRPALVGVACSLICLFIFGSQNFIIPAMVAIIAFFLITNAMAKAKEDRKERV